MAIILVNILAVKSYCKYTSCTSYVALLGLDEVDAVGGAHIEGKLRLFT